MNRSMIIQSQLLATKFFVPMTSGTLISRPRLHTLLDGSLKYPLTLVSAPAGFGKTMLLSTWAQSLPASYPLIAWVSLGEEDNDPRLFWTYALSALDQQQPERFTPLFKYLQSPEAPPLISVLNALCNLVLDSTQHFVLILDDYHLITEQHIHATLSYLVERLPPQLHIILATRADPPLPRAGHRVLEIRTEQLRCTTQEAEAFFKEAKGIHLPDETIKAVNARTEGWLVGLQLLAFSLQAGANPATLLQETSGEQRYILDYLTEVVLGRQLQEVQTFLLSTCMLQRLTASLCDALTQQTDSQQMLQRLEQANLFVVALDSKQQWYRYHALFAEALYCQLEQTQPDLVLILHHRASRWYAQHGQTTEAILHAFKAHQWQWAADLIEPLPIILLAWGASEHELAQLRRWLEQLPMDVVGSRPRLCLACTQILTTIAPHPMMEAWLNIAEATLTASLTTQTDQENSPLLLAPHRQQDLKDLLGEVIAWRALLWSFQQKGRAALALCQQALALLSAQNFVARALVAYFQVQALYSSSVNDAVAAVESGIQAAFLAQEAGATALAITYMGLTALHMIGTGRLRETLRLTDQGILLGTKPGELVLPEVGWPTFFQADILREWNQLDAALSLVEEGISLCRQTSSITSLPFLLHGYAVLLRICLSRGELDTARSTFQLLEPIGMTINQFISLYHRSFFAIIDQVRLWLACEELDRATHWAEELDVGERHGNPFVHEREEVACIRVLLAKHQPNLALGRLEPVLRRATTGQRWGHVIEIRLLQALAHQMRHKETQALDTLSEAVRLAEPEGYIRSFVDEGTAMEALLFKLHLEQCKHRPTPYLDTLLAAFPKESKAQKRLPKRSRQERLP